MKQLNFGCADNLIQGYDNADRQEGADIVFDFDSFPYPIEDNIYEYVYGTNILEHLKYPAQALKELWRCCKEGAIIEMRIPHYNSKGAYDDFEHFHYFSQGAVTRLVENDMFIDKKKMFRLIELEILPTEFSKYIPRWLRNKLALIISGMHSNIHFKLEVIKYGKMY